jgi:tetratricopeptide (TPR) repeat protein
MNHLPSKVIGFSLFYLLITDSAFLGAQIKMEENTRSIPTYPVLPPEKNPMFFRGESYQGASKVIYPYALNDMISNDRLDQDWKELTLENEYIKLSIIPDIGGKLYYATDKTNGYNFIYRNDVVKPSNIGMTGAWVSGGIEWCVLHHHRASTFLPVDYDLIENADGSKTIQIGETEPRHRMRWTLGITAFPGKSYFMNEVKIINSTPLTHTFLYWANVAAHTNKDYQVIFPPSTSLATYHAKNSFTRWPYSTEVYNGEDFTRGVDLSYWENSVHQNSYFSWDLKEDFMGGYDHGKAAGTIHIGDHNIVKGAKLWEWGSGPHGQATEGRLTENSGPYVEIMVGAFSDNQPDYSWIRPYEVKTFRQYWYPVKDIKGFKNANLNGAVNLEKTPDNKIFLGYYSTQNVPNVKIVLRNKEKVVFEKQTPISPEKAFTTLVLMEGNLVLTDLSTEMTDMKTGEILVSYQPVPVKPVEKLPEEVKRPVPPEKMETVEELYLTGSRILQFYNPTLKAMDYFQEALKRDPGDIRTNTAVGTIHLKNWDYEKARAYFAKAIQRLTKDYTRPSDGEALYLQGITLKTLGLYEEAIDTLYRATWDYAWHSAAYLELAGISSLKGEYAKALEQVDQSLATNAGNNAALCMKAALLRKLGRTTEAEKLVKEILRQDPLDFRAGFELYLSSNSNISLDELKRKMRDFNQNYLELALSFLNDGFPKEAKQVLALFPGKNPMVCYHLGYLDELEGISSEAMKWFAEASDMPTDYTFPFCKEDEKVLLMAAKFRPSDARPLYYLGNLLYDKQPARAIGYWEKAVRLDPGMAIAWRNLGWGYNNFSSERNKSIAAYEKAISLKKDEPIYYAELDVLYERNNAPIAIRAALFAGAGETVKKRDDAFVRYIQVLNLSGQIEKSVSLLEKSNFHFREGSSRISDLTVDARLLLGSQWLKEQKYGQALEQFLASVNRKAEDEQAGARDPQINYFIARAYETLGKKQLARQYYSRSANQQVKEAGLSRYYQGLSLGKLGEKDKALQLFQSLADRGQNMLSQAGEPDFFAKFGERQSEGTWKSNAHLLIGLGAKGSGEKESAQVNLAKALQLSESNLWAAFELKNP